MKEKELKELKLTKNIIIPFPNFQQNTIISPTQMNDNFEEIEHAYNTLIDNHNGAITKINKALNDITSTDNDAISNEQARVQAEEIRVQNEEQRISDEDERRTEEKKRIAMYNTHLNDELRREQKHSQMIGEFDSKVNEVNTFVNTKKEEIESFVDTKTEEVEEFVDLKTNQVNSFIITKTNEVDTFVRVKETEVENAINSIPSKEELKGEKGDKGDKGDTPSITHLETSINKKINDVETRFNELTSKQQQDAEVIDARDGAVSLKARLDNFDLQLEDNENLIKNGYVNIKEYNHLVIEGDYTNAIQTALNEKGCVYLPSGTYNISDTLILSRYKSLIGEENSFSPNSTILNYVGVNDYEKTVIQIGGNKVGEEPLIDASTVKVKNIYIKCNNNAGFGIYSTYFTNESVIENIKVDSPISHGVYVAKGWYGYIKNILVQNSLGCGISLAMPLRYSNGTVINWSTPAPLELNNIFIENLRAINCGKDKLFNYNTNSAWGYGIGCGEGNGFNLKSFLAEKCDGAGLYCRIGGQPIHIVQNGYLENNCTNAINEGRSNKAYTVIYETTNTNAHNITLKDTFISYNHTEGIGQKGVNRVKIHLKNISYGRFTSYECERDPFIREECYYGLGYNNDNSEAFIFPIWSDTANLRYSFSKVLPDLIPDTKTMYSIYMITSTDLTFTGGGIYLKDSSNKTLQTYIYPKTTVAANTLTYLGKGKDIAKAYKITEAGNPPFSSDTNVKFVLMVSPSLH